MFSHSYKIGGPIPKFNIYHVWKALNCLDEKTAIGRKKLSSLIGIGEGSTRTILSIMQNQNLVAINRNGTVLTDKGISCKMDLYMDIMKIPAVDITIGNKNCAVRIPKMAYNVKYGCEERDIAIKSGAIGATTLIYSNNRLIFPGSNYPVSEDIESNIMSTFSLKDDDVIIIGTGLTDRSAEIGAVIAGLNAIDGLRFINCKLGDPTIYKDHGYEISTLAFAIHDLVKGQPVCAKSVDNIGIRIENGMIVDNAYDSPILNEAIRLGTTIRKIAASGPYKGMKVIATPIKLESNIIVAIGVIDFDQQTK